MYILEQPGPNQGCREHAINGLKEIGARCKENNIDTIIIADTHWLVGINMRKIVKWLPITFLAQVQVSVTWFPL